MDVLETDRLILRRQRVQDAAELFAFMGDPQAMRYTQCYSTVREVRRLIAAYEKQRGTSGCVPWTILTKADRRIIGRGGLYVDPFDPAWGVELGYHFAPAFWAQGFASELARAALEWGWNCLGLKEVSAFAHPENVASRRVLEKAGFKVERYVPSMDRYLYRISRPGQVRSSDPCA